MSDIARRLAEFARSLEGDRVHLVGHSLGGLVIYRALEQEPTLPPRRVVFLGTPAVASRAAVGVTERVRWGAKVLGSCVTEELLTERTRRWQIMRELGIIAGTRPMGLGQLFARFDGDNDGTAQCGRSPVAGGHRLHHSTRGVIPGWCCPRALPARPARSSATAGLRWAECLMDCAPALRLSQA